LLLKSSLIVQIFHNILSKQYETVTKKFTQTEQQKN